MDEELARLRFWNKILTIYATWATVGLIVWAIE